MAQAKFGVIEVAADQVGAVGGGVGSGGYKRGGKRCIRNVGEVEVGAREGVEGVTYAGGLGVGDEDEGTTVVGEGRAEVIASGTMGSPGWAVAGGVMGDDKLARGVEGMAEEIDRGAEEAGVGGEGGVSFPRGKVIEGEFSVGEKEVPLRKGEVNVYGGEDGDEVVFERANVPFGDIRTVVLGGNILDKGAGIEGVEELGEVGGGFVVGGEVCDGMAMGKEEGEDGFVGGDVGCGGTGWHGDNVGIALVRGSEYVLVTAGGFDGETARQVGKEPVRAGESAHVGGVRGGVKATRCIRSGGRVGHTGGSSSGGVKATRCSQRRCRRGDGAKDGRRRVRFTCGAEVGTDKVKMTERGVRG